MLNPFVSTYRQDYVQKRRKPIRYPKTAAKTRTETVKEFEYLVLDNDRFIQQPEELVDEFTENQFKRKHEELARRYLQIPLNKSEIRKEFDLRKHTIYQTDYKVLLANQPLDQQEYFFTDGMDLPCTTYLSAYRNPVSINKSARIKRAAIVNPVSIGSEKKLHKILNVVTGHSEYQDVISDLGGQIIRDQIFGEIVHPKCGCLEHKSL